MVTRKQIESISYRFSNGITVVNTSPHPLNFQTPEGEKITVATSVLPGEKTGFAVINATAIEKDVGNMEVDTTFEGNDQGREIIDAIKLSFGDEYKTGKVKIIGSMIAANAYPEVKGMCPALGFERVPPQDKLMSCEKFMTGKREIARELEMEGKEPGGNDFPEMSLDEMLQSIDRVRTKGHHTNKERDDSPER